MLVASIDFLCLPHIQRNKTEGEIGVPCVAASCACLGAGKGQVEHQSEKMLSFVRFFRLPPLPDTAAALRCPATSVPLRSTGAAPDERLRLQGQPLSWLLARSGLSWPPPYPPKRSVVPPHLFVGCSRAPLVLRPCLVARPAVPLSER